jgi:phosphate transport system substrate-binding protein
VHRADGSGDTFVFTQYLTYSVRPWDPNLGSGLSIAWPAVAGSLSAINNFGVVQKVQETPYSITYLGISFHAEIAKAQLGTARLKSYSGEFLLPTQETMTAAARSLTPRTPADQLLFGERARRALLSADQLRIRDRLHKAGEPRDRQSAQEIFALGHRTA